MEKENKSIGITAAQGAELLGMPNAKRFQRWVREVRERTGIDLRIPMTLLFHRGNVEAYAAGALQPPAVKMPEQPEGQPEAGSEDDELTSWRDAYENQRGIPAPARRKEKAGGWHP